MISIEIDGSADAFAKLRDAVKRAQSRQTMTQLRNEIADRNRKRFDAETGPDGRPWPPRKQERAQPLLVLTRDLRSSLNRRGTAKRGAAEWGTPVPYSVFHQTGTSRMPARPVMGVTESDLRSLGEILVSVLEREICE